MKCPFDVCDEGAQTLLMVSFIFLFISLLPSSSVQNSGCICVQRLLQAQEKNRKYYFFLIFCWLVQRHAALEGCTVWTGLPLKCFFRITFYLFNFLDGTLTSNRLDWMRVVIGDWIDWDLLRTLYCSPCTVQYSACLCLLNPSCALCCHVDVLQRLCVRYPTRLSLFQGGSHRASVTDDKDPFRFRHMIATDSLQVRTLASKSV